MDEEPESRRGFPWLESLLVLAVVALVLQLFPQVGSVIVSALNPRNWPRTVWFAANVVVILVLLAIRFAPQLLQDWRKRQERLTDENAKRAKQQEFKAQRFASNRRMA